MKFSVYMACYNAEEYIERAISTVLSQSYLNFELIIVDDFSSDSTWEKIQILANTDSRIRHFRNDSKRCIGYSKNFACSQALGDVLVMVDGDDFIAPRALQTLHDAYVAYPQYGCIHSSHYICGADGEVTREPWWTSDYPIDGSIAKRTDKIGHLISFRKDTYVMAGGYDRDRRHATDKQLISRLEEVTRFKFLNTPLYYYRRIRTKASDEKAKERFEETIRWAGLRESGLSVIIPHSGSKRLDLLNKTLSSLPRRQDIEVIVSLSDSDEDVEIPNSLGNKHQLNLKFINNKSVWTEQEDGTKTYNVGRCRNGGARSAFYRRLFFLDSDIVVPNNFFDSCLENIDYNKAWFPMVRNEDGTSERTDDEGFRAGGFGNCGIMKRDFHFVGKSHELSRWGYEDNLFHKKCEVNNIEILRDKSDLIHQFHEGTLAEGWTVPWPVRKKFLEDMMAEYLKEINHNGNDFMDQRGDKVVDKRRQRRLRQHFTR